ncbi:MAG: antitoxin AF2212-like protein [Nitrososphaera sp.]
MKQSIYAVYENGAFKPTHPDRVHIPEGRRVTLFIDDSASPEPLRLAACVYEGLSAQEVNEIEQIALDRSRFFERQTAGS